MNKNETREALVALLIICIALTITYVQGYSLGYTKGDAHALGICIQALKD